VAVTPTQRAALYRQQTADLLAAHEASRSRTGGEVVGDLGVQLLSGAVGLGQAAYGLGNVATLGLLDRGIGLSENFARTQQILQEARSAPLRRDLASAQAAFDRGILPGIGAYVSSPSLMGDLVVSNLPSLIPSVAAARRAGTVAAAAQAAPDVIRQRATRAALRTGAAQAAGATNVDAINTIREAGGGENLQQIGGLGAAAIVAPATYALGRLTGAGALEARVANRLMGGPLAGPAGATPGLVRSTGLGALRAGAEEAPLSMVEQAAANLFAPGVAVTDGVGQAGALGLLAGAAIGAGMGAATAGPRRRTPLREQGEQLLNQTGAAAGADPRPLSVRLDLPLAQVEEVAAQPEEIVLDETALPTESEFERLLNQLRGVSEAPPTPPLPEVEELAADYGSIPLPQVDEGLPLPAVAEIASQPRGTMAYNLREGLDLLGDPQELATLGRRAPEALASPPATSPNQMGLPLDAPTPLQQAIDALVSSVTGSPPIVGPESRDLFGLPLADAAPVADAAPAPAPAAVPPQQRSMALGGIPAEQTRGWREFLAKDLKVTPRQISGKAWARFSEAAVAAGVAPGSPEARPFLEAMAAELGADETTTSTFAAALGEKYMPEQPAPVPAPAVEPAPVPAPAAEPEPAPPAPIENAAAAEPAQEAITPPPAATAAPEPPVADAVDAEIAEADARIRATARKMARDLEPDENATFAAMRDMLADSSSAEEAAEQFGAMKDTESFASLSDAEKAALTAWFDQVYENLSPPGRFYRSGEPAKAGKGIHPVQLRQLVERANARRAGKPPIVLHDTVEAFTEATGIPAPADVAGVFADDGSIHVIAANIRDRSHAGEVIYHERAHEGLGGLLGDRLPAVLNRLQANAAIRKRIRNKAERNGLSRNLAAEEVLVDMVVAGEKLTGDVWGKIRSAVRAGFDSFIGVGDLSVSDAQVDRLLKDTVAYMKGRPVTGSDGLRDDRRWLTLDRMLGDPGALESVPRFSRAMEHLAATVDRAADETPADFSDSAKGVYDATRSAASSTLSSIKDKVRELAMDMMPLNWIEETYAKMFGGASLADNPLRRFVQNKSAKEADSNQTLTRDREVVYRGPKGEEKFTTSPLSLSRVWEKFSRSNRPAFDNLNVLMQYATHYKVWPDRGWDQQASVNYQASGFTEQERRQAHAHLQKLWGRVGTQGQAIFKQSQALYDQLWHRRFEVLRREIVKTLGLRTDENGEVVAEDKPRYRQAVGSRIDTAMKQLKAGPYSPLTRYGDYFVTVRDAAGKAVWFSAYDTEAQAVAAEANLFNSLTPEQQTTYNTRVSKREEFQQSLDGINHQLITQLEATADTVVPVEESSDDQATQAFRKALRDALMETYLAALPGHSLLNHANARTGVEGFNLDAFRAFNDYAIKAARNIASVGFDGEISRDLLSMAQAVRDSATGAGRRTNTAKMDRVLNAVRGQHAASMNVEHSPLADALSQAGFLMYMTSPSQMFINAMQTPMVALPRLAGIYKSGPAMRAIREGMTRFFVGGKRDFLHPEADIDPTIKQVLQALHDSGELDFTLAHDVTQLAEGDYSRMSARRRVMLEWASKAMHASEVFNRQVTAFATAKLELEAGNTDLQSITEAARRAIKTTQFDYSTANKAAIMQGPFRRLVFQFQQYRFNMLAMMYKDIRDAWNGTPEEKAIARRTLAWLMGTQLAFTGAAGTVIAPIVFAIADAFRDDDDLLDSRTEFSRAVPEWMAHGLLSGIIDMSRLDSGSLLPILGDRAFAPKDATGAETAAYYLSRNIGPWASLLSGVVFEGPQKLMDGDFKGAAKAMMPKPMADLVAAWHDADGAKTAQQITYFDPGIWDTTLGMLGLRSGDRRQAEEIRGAGYQASKHANVVRQRYLTRLALGAATGDGALVAEAQNKIMEWNQSNPDYAIRAQDIRRAIRSRYVTQQNAQQYGVVTGRRVGPSLLDSLNLQR